MATAGHWGEVMSTRVAEQACTETTTTKAIMGSPKFARGLSDVRTGVPFDWRIDSWNYERGRLFGRIAPITMPLRIGSKLNPKAVALFDAAFDRGLII
jgi:hypothetical protein